jgi:hypothetical protein
MVVTNNMLYIMFNLDMYTWRWSFWPKHVVNCSYININTHTFLHVSIVNVYIYYYLLFASTGAIENMSTNEKGMLQFKLQNMVRFSWLSYAPCPSQPPRFDHPNNICWRV